MDIYLSKEDTETLVSKGFVIVDDYLIMVDANEDYYVSKIVSGEWSILGNQKETYIKEEI